ncbi:MAG: branched-chain amino acid ABC transporter permease [Propionibacteriaceae bacterium]|nr:branched-chain amino acid ABC transporter permease [Propionibacteriaceae bacterium]
MTEVVQVIVNGLSVGAFYALVALGYSMVYGIIKLLNFAHGDIYMLGAFIGFVALASITAYLPLGTAGALVVVTVLAALLTGLIGVGIERVAYRPIRSAPRLSLLITAVGASFALEYGVRLWKGPSPIAYPAQITGGSLTAGGVTITAGRLTIIVLAAALMAALAWYISKTRDGRAMRAIALDAKAAALMGVNVDRTISLVFFIGSALAGVAGVMAGAVYGTIDFLMGFIIGIKAFTAAVIGGIGNLHGAMLGGLLLGLLEAFGSHWLGGQWRDVFSFICLIVFLSVRPTGLLGKRVVERM